MTKNERIENLEMSKTQDLINAMIILKTSSYPDPNDEIIDEIIQRLREYDELKKLVHATIEPLQFLFEFAVHTLDDEDDITGNPPWVQEEESE